MIATFGFTLLCVACFVAFFQTLLPWLGTPEQPQSHRYQKLSSIQLVSLLGALFCLMALRVMDDFSVLNVANHSNRALPLLYKITGTWGNHEGSMLLWVCILALYGWALAAAGEAGVIRMLELLEAEIRTTMGLMGVTSLAELNPSWVRPATPVRPASQTNTYPLFEEQRQGKT